MDRDGAQSMSIDTLLATARAQLARVSDRKYLEELSGTEPSQIVRHAFLRSRESQNPGCIAHYRRNTGGSLGLQSAQTHFIFRCPLPANPRKVLSLLPATTSDTSFTTSIAFAAAVQMNTFREVNGHSYSSTFTTGNLRTLGEAAFTWLFEGHAQDAARTVRDFSVIVGAFLLGAIAGGVATKALGNRALSCDIGFLVLVAICIQTHFGRPSGRGARSAISGDSRKFVILSWNRPQVGASGRFEGCPSF